MLELKRLVKDKLPRLLGGRCFLGDRCFIGMEVTEDRDGSEMLWEDVVDSHKDIGQSKCDVFPITVTAKSVASLTPFLLLIGPTIGFLHARK